MRSRSLRKQRGTSMILLLEVMLGSIVLTGTIQMYRQHVQSKDLDARLERAAVMDRLLADSVNSYLAENYEILTDQISAGRICDAINRATDPWPAWKQQVKHIGAQYIDDGAPGVTPLCAGMRAQVVNPDWGAAGSGLCSDNQCVALSVADLKTTNMLPNGSSERDEFGSDYVVVIRRSGTAPFYNLDALVATRDPTYRSTGVFLDAMNNLIARVEDANYRAGMTGRDTGVVRPITAGDVAMRPALASAGVGALAAFGNATKGFDGSGNPVAALGWSENAGDGAVVRRWPNLTGEGQVVSRVGYKASQWSSYLRRDGSLPMTGDLNMDDNNIRKAGFVQTVLEAPFDSVCNKPTTGTTPAERAPVGAMARVATGANAIGEGMLLVCQMDVRKVVPTNSTYKWKKLTAGVDVEDDLVAGLSTGYETTEMPVCLGDNISGGHWIFGGIPPGGPAAWSSQKWAKWVYGKSQLGLYVDLAANPLAAFPANWTLAASLSYAGSVQNIYPAISFYNVGSEVNRNAFCTNNLSGGTTVTPAGITIFIGVTDIDRSVLTITPKHIQYHSKAIFGRTAADNTINANIGKLVTKTATGSALVNTYSLDGMGNLIATPVLAPVVTTMDGENVLTQENWISSQVGQTIGWTVTRRSSCVDAGGNLAPNC